MRVALLLLALQMTFLALSPCGDLVAGVECGETTEAEDHGAPDHDDDCASFCSCSCCGLLADAPPALAELEMAETPPPTGQARPASHQDWKTIVPDTGTGPPPRG
ncbi:hypothetical protein GGR26_001838 [Lewinella marina]|uniref:Uncharacterized protein n=1 Tax=Neolewinella marina TaxID=438751 RepID=A0A2G0CHK5_9BACT|nr:hypothetical protein [Neolewinella marina]NJB86070.1 hypothetical protein [Neolewinella marina]PHK99451.1 hypothetical protein CGL56_08340 [Neolewinella marina]